jgi:hypothetical protein
MGEGGGGWGASALGFGGEVGRARAGCGRLQPRGGPGGRKGAWATISQGSKAMTDKSIREKMKA